MKRAVAFQAHTAPSRRLFERAYWVAGAKLADWNRGFGCWPNSVAIGCRLTTELVLITMREVSVPATVGNADARSEAESSADAEATSAPVGTESERSASTTPINKTRQRLVANPPMTPGLVSNMRSRLTSHGTPICSRSARPWEPSASPARMREMTSPEKMLK